MSGKMMAFRKSSESLELSTDTLGNTMLLFLFAVLMIETTEKRPQSYLPPSLPTSFLRQSFAKLLSCPDWALSCSPPASASYSAGSTGMPHHT